MHRMFVRILLAGLVASEILSAGGCGVRDDAIVLIALHPTNPRILYIATNDYIYKSRDEGRTWEKISGGMSHSRVIAMAIDPVYPAIVYAGTKGDAVYKSYDGGQRWVPQKTGLDDVTITSVVNQLVFDPRDREHLFAATTMGIFESVDAGESWKKRMNGMKEVMMVVTLTIDPARPEILYAGTSGGVYKSMDGARTWFKVNQGLIPPDLLSSSRALMVNRVVINQHHAEIVYAGTLNGLYKSVNAGGDWQRIGSGLPDQMIIGLALSPIAPDTVYVAGRQGIFKSIDGGATWSDVSQGLHSLNIRSLALSPSDPNTVYLGTNGTGLYRSHDAGQNWESLPLSAAARK
jgi:photosystem II stability/assembly factor-like uncharacterized protein